MRGKGGCSRLGGDDSGVPIGASTDEVEDEGFWARGGGLDGRGHFSVSMDIFTKILL